MMCVYWFLFKQETAYEMRISDLSSDVCSSDLVEDVARLNGLIIGRERKVFLDAALALGFGIAEPLEKLFSVSDLKIPFGKLALVFEEYIAIGHALIVEGEIIDVVDPLNIHGEPLKSVGQFARYRLAIEAAHLLEIVRAQV